MNIINPDFKITLSNILLGILLAFIVFFFLTRKGKGRRMKTPGNPKSLFKLILIIILSATVLGALFYLLLLPQPKFGMVKFPSTGLSPIAIGTDGLITSFLLVLVAFLVVAVIKNIQRGKAVDRAKTEFVSLASHQLRTPLTAISWYTEMILNGDVGQIIPEQKKYLEEIYQGNKRMIELVNTLLNVSRLEMGTFNFKPELTQLKDIPESIFLELEPHIIAKKITIEKNYDSSLPVIFVDSRSIRIIFQNLIGNAVKYVEVNGKIHVDISTEKLDILIKVWDNGIVIPMESQNKIFTKFFRDDLAREIEPEGNGLGLYIVKIIVESFGGKIWVESEEKKGTTFYVTLPLNRVKK